MVEPRPISLTQIDEADYQSDLAPVPFVVVGPVPGGGGGGGGDVASVNGKTGTVVLDASDVGAAPTNHTQAISTVTGLQSALDGKASAADLDNTFGIATEAHDNADSALALATTAVQPAQIANFVPNTRTVAGKPLSSNVSLDKIDVGLSSVDNTSDANKPVSSAQQTALNLKANTADVVPNTRTVAGKALSANVTLVKADVGLGSVDNTADSAKPVSTAQAAAINAKVGSPNSTVTGVALYANLASLPATGTAGVIYYVDAV